MVKKLNKIKTFICALAFVVCLAMTTTAYADWGGFGSSGGRGGWAQGDGTQSSYPLAKSLHWFEGNSKTCPKVMENMGWRKDLNLIFAYLTPGRGTCDDPPDYCVWNKVLSQWYFGEGGAGSYIGADGRVNFITPGLADKAIDKGFNIQTVSKDSAFNKISVFDWWYNGALGEEKDLLDCIFVVKDPPPPPEPPDDGLRIVYVNGGKGEQVDDRGRSAKWIWDKKRVKPIEYWDRTDPNETVAKRKMELIVMKINKIPVYRTETSCYMEKKCDKDNKCHEEWKCTSYSVFDHWDYEKGGSFPYTKDFTYNTITPTIKQEPFKPWNLNRNGYATTDDISSQYAHAKLPIELDVNNNQGIYDNSPLKALDINNDTFFKFKFTNGYLGMPSVFNWTNPPGTPPGILNNGTWEDAGSGGYANGRNAKADKDGLYRYNVKLHMSMSPNTKKPFVDTSSINFNGSEFTTSEEALQRPPWAGGNMSTRFTYADTYWTDNNKEGSKFPAWWVNTYTMGRFYEYGSEWHGLVTLSGIEDPNNVMYGTGQSTGYDSYKITIDANKQQKGLYVGYASANFEQPIITGTWEVKTVAGYVN